MLMNEKMRTFDLPPGFDNVTSKTDSQNVSSETYDSNLEVVFTEKNDPGNKIKLSFRNTSFFRKSNHAV